VTIAILLLSIACRGDFKITIMKELPILLKSLAIQLKSLAIHIPSLGEIGLVQVLRMITEEAV